jgi:hypothetical protein
MDPSLQELLQKIQDPEEDLEVIMRVVLPAAIPEKVKVISSFGDVITCRIKRKDIEEVYLSPLKFSLKAPKYFSSEVNKTYNPLPVRQKWQPSVEAKNDKKGYKNKVIVGLIDWGCDFTHHNFRNKDGTTRILAIWDQSINDTTGITQPFNYGKVFMRENINAALNSPRPFQYLGYHPAKADNAGIGAHGTHVMDIAAGNGSIGESGVAPDAEYI